ncbi:MAG: hypothetical protein ACJAVK_000436 [Akkermansiaceae bacterium]|jgi:hypothetical protein
MKFLPLLSLIALALTIIPAFSHLLFDLSEQTTFTLMAVGMVIWFAAATPWLAPPKEELDPATQDHL